MTQQAKGREAFEAWWQKTAHYGLRAEHFTSPDDAAFEAWKAARDHYAPKSKTTFTEWIGRFMEPYNAAMKEYARAIHVKPLYGKVEPEQALNSALQSFARWFYENPQIYYQDNSRSLKPTQNEAVDICAKAYSLSQKRFGYGLYEVEKGSRIWEAITDGVKALRVAGVRFKEEA